MEEMGKPMPEEEMGKPMPERGLVTGGKGHSRVPGTAPEACVFIPRREREANEGTRCMIWPLNWERAHIFG